MCPARGAGGPKAIEDESTLLRGLQKIVGRTQVLTIAQPPRRLRSEIRFGSGPVIAAVLPGSLMEQWRVIKVRAS